MAKVLLVEDDNNLREIYEARLQAEGYEIVSASDGDQALVVAKNERPDLVISDVMMPKISGFEMLDILRNTDGLTDVKVIMLTALGQAEDKTRADQLGADRYLVKSQVTLEDIVKTAHQLLDDAPASTPAASATDDASNPSEPANPSAAATSSSTSQPVNPAVAAPVPPEPGSTPTEPAVSTEPTASSDQSVPAITPAASAPQQAADAAAPTAAEEQAEMDSQINTFVEQAPTSVPAIEPQPDQAPAEPQPAAETPVSGAAETAATTPTPAATDTAASAQNDQTMAEAVHSLAEPDVSQQKPSDVTAVEVEPDPSHLVLPNSNPQPTTDTATPAEPSDTPSGDDSTISHKNKVIQPLNEPESKPDLDALLAIEAAKEAAAQSTESATPPAASPTPEAPEDPALQLSPELQAATVEPPAETSPTEQSTPPATATSVPGTPPSQADASLPPVAPSPSPAAPDPNDPNNIAL